jgi:hypothetical protein
VEFKKIKLKEEEINLIKDFMNQDIPSEIDFNWAMTIVDKIESIREQSEFIFITDGYSFNINSSGCLVESVSSSRYNQTRSYKKYVSESDKLKSVVVSILDFINWHNRYILK